MWIVTYTLENIRKIEMFTLQNKKFLQYNQQYKLPNLTYAPLLEIHRCTNDIC
jgi:hypothetical protein